MKLRLRRHAKRDVDGGSEDEAPDRALVLAGLPELSDHSVSVVWDGYRVVSHDQRLLVSPPAIVTHVTLTKRRGAWPASVHFPPGATVILRRDPANPFDPNSVQVFDVTREHLAGDVRSDYSAAVAKYVTNNAGSRGLVLARAESPGAGQLAGLMILVTELNIEFPTPTAGNPA